MSHENIGKLRGASLDLKQIRRVLVVAAPELGVEGEFCEDVVSVKMMAAGFGVVSRELREQEQLVRLAKMRKEIEKETKSSEETDKRVIGRKPKEGLSDLLTAGQVTKTDALVIINLVADPVQRNIYANDPLRVMEVRNELSVRSSSVTVVDVDTGKVVHAASVNYPDGVSLEKAAVDIGENLVEQLRKNSSNF